MKENERWIPRILGNICNRFPFGFSRKKFPIVLSLRGSVADNPRRSCEVARFREIPAFFRSARSRKKFSLSPVLLKARSVWPLGEPAKGSEIGKTWEWIKKLDF